MLAAVLGLACTLGAGWAEGSEVGPLEVLWSDLRAEGSAVVLVVAVVHPGPETYRLRTHFEGPGVTGACDVEALLRPRLPEELRCTPERLHGDREVRLTFRLSSDPDGAHVAETQATVSIDPGDLKRREESLARITELKTLPREIDKVKTKVRGLPLRTARVTLKADAIEVERKKETFTVPLSRVLEVEVEQSSGPIQPLAGLPLGGGLMLGLVPELRSVRLEVRFEENGKRNKLSIGGGGIGKQTDLAEFGLAIDIARLGSFGPFPVPGISYLPFEQQLMVMHRILVLEKAEAAECFTRNVVGTKPTSRFVDALGRKPTLPPSWSERWTIARCAVTVDYVVAITSATGGAEIEVSRATTR